MDSSRERPDLVHEPAWVRWLFETGSEKDDYRLVVPAAARNLERWFAWQPRVAGTATD